MTNDSDPTEGPPALASIESEARQKPQANSNTGRWTQQDPLNGTLANTQTADRYTYAGDNPITNSDPSGTSFLGDLIGGVVGGLSALVGAGPGVYALVDGFAGEGIFDLIAGVAAFGPIALGAGLGAFVGYEIASNS